MRIAKLLILAAAVGLQGCVVDAARDAMTWWDSYSVIAARQIDARNFRILVSTAHNRGEFDLLGTHGSHVVTRSVDLELWRLTLTDNGTKITKEDTQSFSTEDEINGFYYTAAAIDMARGRIALTPEKQTYWGAPRYHNVNLQIDFDKNKAYGLVNGNECAVSWPPFDSGQRGVTHDYAVSDQGDYLMVMERDDRKTRPARVLNVCDPNAASRRLDLSPGKISGFTTDLEGNPRVIRRILRDDKAADGRAYTYEAQVYPTSQRLAVNQEELGLDERRSNLPQDFMFDEQSRRFFWIAAPFRHANFKLISHDTANRKTTTYEFTLGKP
jgi:hypothetical protein